YERDIRVFGPQIARMRHIVARPGQLTGQWLRADERPILLHGEELRILVNPPVGLANAAAVHEPVGQRNRDAVGVAQHHVEEYAGVYYCPEVLDVEPVRVPTQRSP